MAKDRWEEEHDVRRKTRRGKLALYSEKSGWALCVGAGISVPFFPDWNELALKVVQASRDTSFNRDDIKSMIDTFGPAPAMQAAFDWVEDREEFSKIVSKALYGPLRKSVKKQFGKDSWAEIESKALSATSSTSLQTEEWELYLKNLKKISKSPGNKKKPCSAFGIAKAVSAVIDTKHRPSAILSFNADTLLFSLILANYARRTDGLDSFEDRVPLARMGHDLSQRRAAQVPFYHIHGLVPIPDQSPPFNQVVSDHKLVFSEGQYLSLSNQAYSWQSTNFLSVCLHHRCVFAGVSFTDPNLRRWLAWQHQSRTVEREAKDLPKNAHYHFWFKKHPNAGKRRKLTKNQQLQQASVDHLGVRIIWIKDYPEIGERLKEMLEPNKK